MIFIAVNWVLFLGTLLNIRSTTTGIPEKKKKEKKGSSLLLAFM